MKKTILLILLITSAWLLFPAIFFAEPGDYIKHESSSYGLVISKKAKLEAIQQVSAREERMLSYEDEIDSLASEIPLETPCGAAGDGGQEDAGAEESFYPVIGNENPDDAATGICSRPGCGESSRDDASRSK